MSHPLTFRVWDGEEMHEPPHDFIVYNGEVRKAYPQCAVDALDLSPERSFELMWATGLTDAEGTEIWEGDIIETIYDIRYEIVWNNTWARFDARALNQRQGDFIHAIESSPTIIGNRYEDPDLVE